MANFGLARLCLVQPHADPLDAQALALATHGEGVLRTAESFKDLGDAASDCGLVIGSSARAEGLIRGQTVSDVRSLMKLLVPAIRSVPAALVFGPESTGLTNAEVTRCHHLLTIPAASEFPVLNLAQAVAICLSELFQAWIQAPSDQRLVPNVASFAVQELAYRRLEEALTGIHFLWNAKAPSQMHALRHLLGRAQPTEIEVGILHGIARQILWYVKRWGHTRDDAAEPTVTPLDQRHSPAS